MVTVARRVGLQVPKTSSPADYLIEVANSVYGAKVQSKLGHLQRKRFRQEIKEMKYSDVPQLPIDVLRNRKVRHPVKQHIWYIALRSLLMTIRDPLVFAMRFGSR